MLPKKGVYIMNPVFNKCIKVLVLGIFVGSCQNSPVVSTLPGAVSRQGSEGDSVPVFLLTQKLVQKTIELPAELLPFEQAEILARVPGYIKELKVDIGDVVQKGQTLAVIQAPEVNTKYAEFQSSLYAAKAKYSASADNYHRLLEASRAITPGVVAPVDLERNRQQMLADSSSYQAAEKLAQSYKEISGYLVISAPFSGVITARKADPGNLAGAGVPLLSLQNDRTLRLRVAVPEAYGSTRIPSDTISFSVDAFPERRFVAKFARKSETIDPVTRTEQWEFDYDNAKRQIKAGSFAYIHLNLSRAVPSFVVPSNAVITTQEKKFVIRVKEGKAQWVEIRQGITLDNGIEIFANLQVNDSIVSGATDELKAGSVRIWKPANSHK